jgi:hypothetical protein
LNKKLIFCLQILKAKKSLEVVNNMTLRLLPKTLYNNHFNLPIGLYQIKQVNFLQKNVYLTPSKRFLKNLITSLASTSNKILKFKSKANILFFFNIFFIKFLEFFFKSCIVFNLKKGTNKLILKQVSFRKFSFKYFKRNLKTTKQILGVLYYSLLLKDASIFINFFKKIIEQLNIKLHKKLLLSLRRLIKDFFLPIFPFLGVSGVFLNVKGKIGVSGSAKKRRYYFYFGKHSITTRSLKMDFKFLPI